MGTVARCSDVTSRKKVLQPHLMVAKWQQRKEGVCRDDERNRASNNILCIQVCAVKYHIMMKI